MINIFSREIEELNRADELKGEKQEKIKTTKTPLKQGQHWAKRGKKAKRDNEGQKEAKPLNAQIQNGW